MSNVKRMKFLMDTNKILTFICNTESSIYNIIFFWAKNLTYLSNFKDSSIVDVSDDENNIIPRYNIWFIVTEMS